MPYELLIDFIHTAREVCKMMPLGKIWCLKSSGGRNLALALFSLEMSKAMKVMNF